MRLAILGFSRSLTNKRFYFFFIFFIFVVVLKQGLPDAQKSSLVTTNKEHSYTPNIVIEDGT